MNENTIKLVQELASKLGTTAEHLWGVLVRQAPISAVTDILILATSAVITWVSARAIIRGLKGLERNYDHDGMNVGIVIGGGIVCAIAAICLLGCIFGLGTTFSGFLNPEYWALKQIIK